MPEVGDYRVRLERKPQVTGRGDIVFQVLVQRYDERDVGGEIIGQWATVQNGNFPVRFPGETIIEIADGPGTLAQKRQEVLARIAQMVTEKGIAESDLAERAFRSLLPGGTWPTQGVNISLEV